MITIEKPPETTLLEQLEDEIVSGALKPGTHLGEVALAARLGVSRTPLRSALALLAERGMVRIVPNVGAFVAEITPKEVAELFLVRRRAGRGSLPLNSSANAGLPRWPKSCVSWPTTIRSIAWPESTTRPARLTANSIARSWTPAAAPR